MSSFLEIKNLHVNVAGKAILNGLNLSVSSGEVHAIMGPNGSGKSTLSYTLAGKDGYEVTAGQISFLGRSLTEQSIEERAAAGLFLALQYPVEIPGVTTINFLRTAVNAVAKAKGKPEPDAATFLRLLRAERERLGMSDEMVKRSLNVGYSGGEKKRNEVLQMSMLKPRLCVLDETDSGLDIDAMKIVSGGINSLRAPERSFIVITHYQRLLDLVVPDFVHVLANGRIIKSGGADLAQELEANGYDAVIKAA